MGIPFGQLLHTNWEFKSYKYEAFINSFTNIYKLH